MSDAEWISVQIGRLRQESGRSLRDVAAYCEVTHAAVLSWEHGHSVPSAVSLVRLSRLFGVSLDTFDRQIHQ